MGFNTTITIENLSLQRGDRRLVDNLNLSLKSGDGLELRGPNGTGKTTFLRAIAGLHRPKSGKIIIDVGIDNEAYENLMFLGHSDGIKNNENVQTQLEFWADFFGAPKAKINDAIETLDIGYIANLAGGVLSAGQRRRVALARLLISGRPVWLLDEPAAPLDEKGRLKLGQLFDAHRDNGGIIILAAHDKPPGRDFEILKIDEYRKRGAQ